MIGEPKGQGAVWAETLRQKDCSCDDRLETPRNVGGRRGRPVVGRISQAKGQGARMAACPLLFHTAEKAVSASNE